MLILSVMGVTLISLVTTGSDVSINQLQSEQAFNVTEGGIEYEQRSLAQNLDWYRSVTDPMAITTRNLGAGSFTVSSNLPATMLRNRIPTAASTAPVRVYTTNRFPSSGYIQIEEDFTGNAEFIQYTNIVGDTFAGIITRNVTIGGINNPGGASPHARGMLVYPVTTLIDNMPNNCTSIASLRVATHPKFLGAGTLDVEGEEITYTGSSVSGGNMTLTGVQRCQNGTASAAHPPGRPVTPVLVGGVSPDFEAETVSTGSVSSAVRVVRKTVQR